MFRWLMRQFGYYKCEMVETLSGTHLVVNGYVVATEGGLCPDSRIDNRWHDVLEENPEFYEGKPSRWDVPGYEQLLDAPAPAE